MFVWNKTEQTDDEIILCVRYTENFWRLYAIVILLSIAAAFIAGTYAWVIPQGKYARAIFILAAGSVALLLGLEFLFTKRIVFYGDRVVKEWHLLGERTIFYHSAMLVWASRLNTPRKGKNYIIRRVERAGNMPWLQVPIWLVAVCISPETDKKVDAILSYLVGVDDGSTPSEKRKRFHRTELPKDIR